MFLIYSELSIVETPVLKKKVIMKKCNIIELKRFFQLNIMSIIAGRFLIKFYQIFFEFIQI